MRKLALSLARSPPLSEFPMHTFYLSSSSSLSKLSLADGLDYDLGKGLGLTRKHEVPTSVVQSVIHAADQGNRGADG